MMDPIIRIQTYSGRVSRAKIPKHRIRDRAGPGPKPGFFLYLESRSRHFFYLPGVFLGLGFPGLQAQDPVQVKKSNL